MSPAKFHDDEHARREINGSRPSPLKINKDSHLIQKYSSSTSSSYTNSSTSSSNSSVAAAVAATKYQHPATTTMTHQQRHPVIIYTHSPKIIHTQARDFMALVQKLTGLSRSNVDETVQPQPQQALLRTSSSENDNNTKRVGNDDNESSSVLTDENCGGVVDVQVSSSSVSPIFNLPNPYFADIPLFTPTSTDFFCSPRPVYRYPDTLFSSPNMGNSISPSVFEFMKGLPEY